MRWLNDIHNQINASKGKPIVSMQEFLNLLTYGSKHGKCISFIESDFMIITLTIGIFVFALCIMIFRLKKPQ